MKKTLAKTLRSALSLVLALTLVLGSVGTAFAAQPSADSLKSAVGKLVDLLEQYGPDVVEEARQYVDRHGYVKAVKETAAALKAALNECAAEHEYLAGKIKDMLAGPMAELAALKKQAKNLVTLIALYKAGGASAAAETAAVITIPGYGTIDTDKITEDYIKDFDVDDLTEDQKQAIEDSGLLGDVKLDDLTDEQVEAIKDAGLKGEINPDVFTEEQLKDLQNAQNKLNQTIEAIEKTEQTVNELQEKLASLKAVIDRLKEAAEGAEDLSDAIISILKQETVHGAQVAAEKYVAVRNALLAKLKDMDKSAEELAELALDVTDLTITVVTEVKDLTIFITKDLVNTVKNNKLLIAGAFVKVAEKLGVSQETLEEVAQKVQEKLTAAVEKVRAKAAELKAKAYKAYKEATTADLHITYGTNYVAIGDDAVAADDSYADLLNAALKMPYDVDKSMAVEGVLIQNTELDAEAIAEAELITIGYSAANFTGSVADAILGAKINWSEYLPEKGVKAVNKVLDEIKMFVDAMGFSDYAAKALNTSIEYMAFNSLVYAYQLPKTISAIREINEDAVLVVVGLDNPLEDVAIGFGDNSMGLDTLSKAVVALTDIYTLHYAILANNCTFVSAPNARNNLEGTEITRENLAASLLTFGLLPNEEGQKYIQERIYNALTVTYGFLWGDANLDQKLSYKDALIILQYSIKNPVMGGFIYLPVCDVDDNGKLTYKDALLILRKSIKLVDKFPVEG